MIGEKKTKQENSTKKTMKDSKGNFANSEVKKNNGAISPTLLCEAFFFMLWLNVGIHYQ